MGQTFCALIIMLGSAACTADVPVGTDGTDPNDPNDPTDPGSDPNDPGSYEPGTYHWVNGSFGACSAPCGGGTQARSVICADSSGVPVDASLCAATEQPADQQACNTQSCTNANCDPVYVPGAVTPLTPATGPAPLTVTFNVAGQSTFAWDAVWFGDGSTVPEAMLTWKLIPNYGYYGCVKHTYTRAATFSVGRHPKSATYALQDTTVHVN